MILALVFALWMLLVHEPRDLVTDEMMGVVTAVPPYQGGAGTRRVELEDGRTIAEEKPSGMPSRIGIRVRMEA